MKFEPKSKTGFYRYSKGLVAAGLAILVFGLGHVLEADLGEPDLDGLKALSIDEKAVREGHVSACSITGFSS